MFLRVTFSFTRTHFHSLIMCYVLRMCWKLTELVRMEGSWQSNKIEHNLHCDGKNSFAYFSFELKISHHWPFYIHKTSRLAFIGHLNITGSSNNDLQKLFSSINKQKCAFDNAETILRIRRKNGKRNQNRETK